MSAWLRIESNLVHHYKVQRLADHLGVRKADAGWAIMGALSWFSQFCPTGQVAGQHRDSDATALEKFCEWGGAPGQLVAGLLATGLMDVAEDGGFAYHDWPEYQGKVTVKAEKEKNRKAAWRAKKAAEKAAKAASGDDLSNGTSHGTNAGRPALRDVTGRDETRRSSSYEDDGADAPSPPNQFFAWFQEQRVAAGWAAERAPPGEELAEFFQSASAALKDDSPEGTREALEVATRGFSKDPYWLKRALPWAGFTDQWLRHVRKAEQQAMALGVLGGVS